MSNVDLANRAAEAAGAAFTAWSEFGPNARRFLLNAAADAIEARADRFVELMREELRASEPWARFNVQLGAGMVREAAALTTQITGEVIPSDKPGLLSLALREPAGVVLGIAPWNAPVILGARAIATPLACGNTVFLKAAERCPRTHGLLVEAFRAAEFARRLAEKAASMPAAAIGQAVDADHVNKVQALIDDALTQGARQIAGAPAAVIDGVTAAMRLYRDESFGPVVGIIRVTDEEEAIRVANDSEYGLSAPAFTRDAARGLRVARRIRPGICHVTGPTVQDERQMPFA